MPMTSDHPGSWSLLDQLCVETNKQIRERGVDRVVEVLLMQFGTEGRAIAFRRLSEADPQWRGGTEDAP